QEQREELREEARGAAHEGLGPVGEERLPGGGRRQEGCSWGQQKNAPAAKREPHQQPEAEQDAEEAHRVRRPPKGRRGRGTNAVPDPRRAWRERTPPSGAPRRAACKG